MWTAPLQLTNHSINFHSSYVMFTTGSFCPYRKTKYNTRVTNVPDHEWCMVYYSGVGNIDFPGSHMSSLMFVINNFHMRQKHFLKQYRYVNSYTYLCVD